MLVMELIVLPTKSSQLLLMVLRLPPRALTPHSKLTSLAVVRLLLLLGHHRLAGYQMSVAAVELLCCATRLRWRRQCTSLQSLRL